MWMNAAKTMCAPGAGVSTLMALSCACVRLALNSMLTRLTAKVRFLSDVLSCMTLHFLTSNPWGFLAQSKPTRQCWLVGRYAFSLKRAQCSTVGHDGLSIASGDEAPVKVSKPGLEAFLHGPSTERCLDYMTGTLEHLSPEESMNDPIVSRRCFSLWNVSL